VVALIRQAILSGSLRAGAPLVEAQLAQEMGVSRAPIREALLKLGEQGLVVNIPYRGTYVTEVSPHRIRDIISLRAVLETLAAERSLPALRAGGLAQLEESFKRMRAAADSDNASALVDAHLGFHRVFYELADNAMLLQFWMIMEEQLRLYLHVNHRMFAHPTDVCDAHTDLLRSVQHGDPEELVQSISHHVVDGAGTLLSEHHES
jgi:DNA-binding GntR family transcriptional regulator